MPVIPFETPYGAKLLKYESTLQVYMKQMNIVIQVGDLVVVNPSESAGAHLKPYRCTDIPTSAKNKLGQGCADFNDHPDFK